MPGPANTLLIEGSFEELADELAHYIDEVQKKQNPDNANVQTEIAPLLEKGQKDEALKKLVTASDVLNTAPEKGGLALFTCHSDCVLKIAYRIHSSLQPSRPSNSPITKPRQIPPQNLPEPLRSNKVLPSQRSRPRSFYPDYNIQHSPLDQ